MNHKGTQRIETERLILRKFAVSDAQQIFDNWANDSEVTKYLTWQPHETVNFTKKLLTDLVKEYQKDNYYTRCLKNICM